MITIGLDLSLSATGISIIEGDEILLNKLIKSKPSGDKPLEELLRIEKIVEDIESEICEFLPEDIKMVAIEGLAFMARNTTALVQLSALNYMVRSMLSNMNIPFVIVAPTSLKKFVTGKGNGPKDNVMLEVYKRYGVSISDNNIADSFSLAKCAEALINKSVKLNKTSQEVINLLKKQLK